MKLCPTCGQSLADDIDTCPACGSRAAEGRRYIDDYRIVKVVHEGHATILCKAVREGWEQPVMIRLFKKDSGVDQKVADRLKRELSELRKLPRDRFVAHRQIKRSADGLWYRVSQWVDAENWGDLVVSGRLNDYKVTFDLFEQIALAIDQLHDSRHSIPHLILDDVLVLKGENGALKVLIDYKLSRFIDRNLDRPGPMLKKLLTCHPDLVNKRPLDRRTDIWSLGRIFVQILTADFETCELLSRVDGLPLPTDIRKLLKTMLAEEPDLRPQSMTEVADALARVTERDIKVGRREYLAKTIAPLKRIPTIEKRLKILGVVTAAIIIFGGWSWFYFGYHRRDAQAVLGDYANQYAGSVAFVAVEYWLRQGDVTAYRNRIEGTAFLVDRQGYLLTNRHVACPWLEDTRLPVAVQHLMQSGRPLSFDYRIYLWFEGTRAFSRLPDLAGDAGMADVYFLDTAFRSDGVPGVSIAGVARSPVTAHRLLHAPLRDDFAVLKIDRVPARLKPLPLRMDLEAQKIPKLSPVITIGFPLGSRTQQAHVNVSVTHGHVRRSFEHQLQVDTSLYGGNSGGPIIDISGKVIGIASAVAFERAPGMVPVFTPLSDIGMVLPITKAARFLSDLKLGRAKWNGVLDLSLAEKLKQIKAQAGQGRWAEAKALADQELIKGLHPSLVMVSGIMDFCAGSYDDAKKRFAQALSMDDGNTLARLMLYLIHRMNRSLAANVHRKPLLALDWRSPDEFLGYLTRVLEQQVDEKTALTAWETAQEKAWLYFAAGLIRSMRGDPAGGRPLLQTAVLSADPDNWVYFLASAQLDLLDELYPKGPLEQLPPASFESPDSRADDRARRQAFALEVKAHLRQGAQRRKQLETLEAKFAQKSATLSDKVLLLEKMQDLDSENRNLVAQLAFHHAMAGKWSEALTAARRYLGFGGRESAMRLKAGLLEAECLFLMGRQSDAADAMGLFHDRTKDPWYRAIAECLLKPRKADELEESSGQSPEQLITAHTALGLWAEAKGERQKAVAHYKEALGSYIDYWPEFDLARERIRHLRQPG